MSKATRTQVSIQELFWELYDGIEKWQRLEVYESAIRSGSEYHDALTKAKDCPVVNLPEIVFEVGTTIEASSKEECDRIIMETKQQ